MKKGKLHILIAACTILVACNTDNGPEVIYSDIPIGFSTILANTRAGDITTANLTSMVVYAYASGTTEYTPETETFIPNYMLSQQMQRDITGSAGWTYSPIKYWPLNPNEKISFFAYAPYIDNTVTGGDILAMTTETDVSTGATTLSSCTFTNNTATTDLLFGQVQNCTQQTNSVTFQMKHALARVSFYIRTTRTDDATLTVTNLKVQGYKEAIYSVPQGRFVEIVSSSGSITYSKDVDIVIPQSSSAASLGTFFMIPVYDTAFTFTITYTDSSDSASPKTITGNYTNLTWASGDTVAYELIIKPTA